MLLHRSHNCALIVVPRVAKINALFHDDVLIRCPVPCLSDVMPAIDTGIKSVEAFILAIILYVPETGLILEAQTSTRLSTAGSIWARLFCRRT